MEEFEGENMEFVLFYIIKLSVIVKPPNPILSNPRDMLYRKMPHGGPGDGHVWI
jgi:hypothetical protein